MVTEGHIRELDRQVASDFIPESINPMILFSAEVAEDTSSSPDRFRLGSLRDGRLRVSESIDVRQMIEGNQCVVEALELNEFGFGENLPEAIKDLQAAIAELYFTLEVNQSCLGPDLASVWSTLSRKVRKADAVVCSRV